MTALFELLLVFVLALSIALSLVRPALRWWRRRAIRKELQLLRGGRPEPMFTSYGELVNKPPRPPVRSLRNRGDSDAA